MTRCDFPTPESPINWPASPKLLGENTVERRMNIGEHLQSGLSNGDAEPHRMERIEHSGRVRPHHRPDDPVRI